MTPGPAALIAPVRERWQRFSRLQRVALVGGTMMLIALIIGFVAWSQQTTYGVLFSNLNAQDASAIVTKLKASKIPYQLADNGNAIMVPTGMVDETRLMLAGAGLPNQGVVGFEIFDKSNPLTMTDFTQQLDYQRGLEGELTRTIEQINGVTGAWVHIVLPQSSLYTSAQQNPTASIVVALAQGTQLDPGQVKAVMHLVASAVQGLKPENVTVVDTSGVNLSDQVQAGTLANGVTAATLGSALDVEHQFEQDLSQQAMSMLATVLGSGKAVVRVNAALNWDQLQQDSTTYGQQPSQIANQSTSSTTSSGGSSTTGGPPGTGSNLVPTPTPTTGAGSSTYSQTQTNTVYNVSQTVAHLVKAPGSVQRLTVAVFVDGTYPAATITAIQQAVGNAIGLDAARGDQIVVSAIPFNHTNEVAAQNALKAQQQQATNDLILRGALLAIIAVALLIFALRATRRFRHSLAPGRVSLAPEIVGLDGAPDGQNAQLAAPGSQTDAILLNGGGATDLLEQARQRQQLEADQQRRTELRNEIASTARQHPELLANVILSWLEE